MALSKARSSLDLDTINPTVENPPLMVDGRRLDLRTESRRGRRPATNSEKHERGMKHEAYAVRRRLGKKLRENSIRP